MWLRVAVAGGSMEPTLRGGDWLLARRVRDGAAVLAGEVVLLEHPGRRELLLVKRALRRTPRGWWVEGDNPDASDDSRTFGVVPDDCVRARVLVRYHPAPGRVHADAGGGLR